MAVENISTKKIKKIKKLEVRLSRARAEQTIRIHSRLLPSMLLLLLLCQATLQQIAQRISLQQVAMPPAEQVLTVV